MLGILACQMNGKITCFVRQQHIDFTLQQVPDVTHTHTCLTTLCPGLPEWAGTRKVKPICISLKQETVSGSGISWAICQCAPHSTQITMPAPHHSVFYMPDALPATQPTASKHWRQFNACDIMTRIKFQRNLCGFMCTHRLDIDGNDSMTARWCCGTLTVYGHIGPKTVRTRDPSAPVPPRTLALVHMHTTVPADSGHFAFCKHQLWLASRMKNEDIHCTKTKH